MSAKDRFLYYSSAKTLNTIVMFTIIPLSSCILYHLFFEILGILKPFFKEGFKPPEARSLFKDLFVN